MASFWLKNRRKDVNSTDGRNMSAFGPTPIQPSIPGVIQSAFIAQHTTGAKPREKTKPQDADTRRVLARDEVRLSDPMKAEAIDPKPDAAEEWKHRRPRTPRDDGQKNRRRDPRFGPDPRSDDDGGISHIDLKA